MTFGAEFLLRTRRISVDEGKGRRRLYEKLGKPVDDSVDWEGAAAWFKDLLSKKTPNRCP